MFLFFIAKFPVYIWLQAADQLRIKREEQLSIYVRRWSPSKYELGGITEIIVDEDSSNDLIKKVCLLCLPVYFILAYLLIYII